MDDNFKDTNSGEGFAEFGTEATNQKGKFFEGERVNSSENDYEESNDDENENEDAWDDEDEYLYAEEDDLEEESDEM